MNSETPPRLSPETDMGFVVDDIVSKTSKVVPLGVVRVESSVVGGADTLCRINRRVDDDDSRARNGCVLLYAFTGDEANNRAAVEVNNNVATIAWLGQFILDRKGRKCHVM